MNENLDRIRASDRHPWSRAEIAVASDRFAVLWAALILWCFLAAVVRSPAAEALWITEFMSINVNTLKDDLGEFSDWIEIFNAGPATASLEGYYLTDDPANLTQWRFPAVNLSPKRYLVVFASGRNRATPPQPLHTNFRLNGEGEYLALVSPDGFTILSEYQYGPQEPGRSFGLAVEEITSTRLLGAGTEARIRVPTSDIGKAWTALEFNDSAWFSGPLGAGFTIGSSESPLTALIATDVASLMREPSARSTAYLRIGFSVADLAVLPEIQFGIRYDDGFVAYLNGQEIGRRNTPAAVQWNSNATVSRDNRQATITETIHFPGLNDLLKPGRNVLAIHGMNRASADEDFLILPELVAQEVKVVPEIQLIFVSPTPGGANTSGFPGAAPTVRFSHPTRTFTTPFPLEIEPEIPAPGAVIRYTLDRRIPTESSPLYTGPINLDRSVQVRARVFMPGMFPGPIASESYLLLNPNVLNFSSDLPIVVIHTLGGGAIGGNSDLGAVITIHEPVRGRSSLTNTPHFATRAGLKTRGSSTGAQPKANYAVEFWDELDDNRDLPLLGMPADSDWVFHAPYNWDPSGIRNPMAFEFSHQLGRYAPRYRFAEVFVNANAAGGALAFANYAGLYNLVEKIKRGKNRVAIDELRPGDNQPPEITGGYVLKVDRLDPGDTGFSAGGKGLAYIEPKESEMKSQERDPQEKYLTGYLNAFNAALASRSFTNAVTGYAPYLDAGAWIDFHIVDTLAFNVDALVLSSYFHKARNGPLVYGPVWDYDRALGSTDGRDANPRTWGANFFTAGWWSRLFQDPDFWQGWIDRWQSLRQTHFSSEGFHATIDSLAAQVQEAAPRDFTRWRQTKRGGSQQSEINFTKNWLMNRADFVDSQFVRPPVLSSPGEQIYPGYNLVMAGPPGAALYYTLDGSDPRLAGGALSPGALAYTGPILLAEAAIVKARARDLQHRPQRGGNAPPLISPWSGLTESRFSAYPPVVAGSVALTEIQFHPSPPAPKELNARPSLIRDDFEFLELKNISAEPVDLLGARFTEGIDFSFSGDSATKVLAGQTLLLVINRLGFEIRYGEHQNIAGQYQGSLDDKGERIVLVNAAGAIVLAFEYDDRWYPATDGHGFSLVLRPGESSPNRWNQPASWRTSANRGGSPGVEDPPPALIPEVVVSEVLSHAGPNQKDAIELHNPTTANAKVGGWYLTDDLNFPAKFRLPDRTEIPPGGYLVFKENDFNENPDPNLNFLLNAAGDSVYLFSADVVGQLTGYAHGFEFGPVESGVTFGRHLTSVGEDHFVAQLAPSLKAPNPGPRVGPIVINEIMYRPSEEVVNNRFYDNVEDEFIELHNLTGLPAPLFDVNVPTNRWRLRAVQDFVFPANTVIPPQGYLVVVGFNPVTNPDLLNAFRNKFGVPSTTLILGPIGGILDNSTETVQLLRPGAGDLAPPQAPELRYLLVDLMRYSRLAPWPIAADGLGLSLQRRRRDDYGNDPGNWTAASPTPGVSNADGPPPLITVQPKSETILAGETATFQISAQGSGVLRYQWRFQQRNIPGANNAFLTIANAPITAAGDYEAIVLTEQNAAVSLPAKLIVRQPPVITRHPAGAIVNPGANVQFLATASGEGRLTYQWLKDSKPLAGENQPILTLTNVQFTQSGNYSVVINDSIGSAASRPADLKVLLKPVFTLQPQSQIALVGDTITLTAAAYGTLPMSFRWRVSTTFLAGRTNSSLTLQNVKLTDSGVYSLVVSNLAAASTVSREAVLVVLADADKDRMADAWEQTYGLSSSNARDAARDEDGDGLSNLQEFLADTDPRDFHSTLKIDTISLAGDTASLQFVAKGSRNYTLQYKESLNGGRWTSWTNLDGLPTQRVETVLDPFPFTTSRLYRLITPQLREIIPTGPFLLASPLSITVPRQGTAHFSVLAVGAGPLVYQWRFKGALLPGETRETLTLGNVASNQAGEYSVLVTDQYGTTQSEPANLQVSGN